VKPVIEHSLALAGHRTRVLELEGAGPGFVLLHGWGDSADTWRPLLAVLGQAGRRAVAADLPGFGRASGLGPGAILPQLDDFAAALVQEWGAGEPVVVAGTSLGGCVALRLAEHAGDLALTGVIPVAPAGLELPGWFDAAERDPIIRRLLDMPIPVPAALVRRFVGGEALSVPRRPQPGLGGPPVLAHAPFDLAAAGCPVLLVWGARDRTVPHGGARVAIDALPATRVELIDGCGPCPQLEATDRLLELLLAFPAR
jgi:pimeloyl-ACP methyl ester carboxylesterase